MVSGHCVPWQEVLKLWHHTTGLSAPPGRPCGSWVPDASHCRASCEGDSCSWLQCPGSGRIMSGTILCLRDILSSTISVDLLNTSHVLIVLQDRCWTWDGFVRVFTLLFTVLPENAWWIVQQTAFLLSRLYKWVITDPPGGASRIFFWSAFDCVRGQSLLFSRYVPHAPIFMWNRSLKNFGLV